MNDAPVHIDSVPLADRAPMGETISETEDFRLLFAPGDGDARDLVVAFAGQMRGMGGIWRREFAGVLRHQGRVRDTLYVVDKKVSWYNRSAPAIAAALAPVVNGRRFHMLGNSMGGFGAILFSRLLPGCVSATAFVPTFSPHRIYVPEDLRQQGDTDRLPIGVYPTCVPPDPVPDAPPPIIVCGADAPDDHRHARAIRAALHGRASVFVIDGCHHDAARYLLRWRGASGALAHVLDAAMTSPGQAGPVAAALTAFGVPHVLWADGPGDAGPASP